MEPQHPAPKGTLQPGTYSAKHIIVATGARPRVLPGIEPDGQRIWTYFEAMVPPTMPKSLIVMGSGAIGIEFASFYRTLGAEVTVIELLPQILPVEDAEIAALARKQFEKQGMKILTGAKVTKVEKSADGVTATVDLGDGKTETLKAERLISAVGVQGNVEGLGLEALGMKMDRGTIVTDGLGRTNVPGIYAIGDVAGPPMLAHKAEHEGVICVETIKGLHTHPMDKRKIPGCTYCHPQVASVGLTEAKAKEAGYQVKVGRFPFRGNGKAIALGEPEGLVKTVFDAKTGQLLGAHMVGAEVTELIQGYRGRHATRDDRGGPDAHGLPSSHAQRNDARERARRLRPGHSRLTPRAWHMRTFRPHSGVERGSRDTPVSAKLGTIRAPMPERRAPSLGGGRYRRDGGRRQSDRSGPGRRRDGGRQLESAALPPRSRRLEIPQRRALRAR